MSTGRDHVTRVSQEADVVFFLIFHGPVGAGSELIARPLENFLLCVRIDRDGELTIFDWVDVTVTITVVVLYWLDIEPFSAFLNVAGLLKILSIFGSDLAEIKMLVPHAVNHLCAIFQLSLSVKGDSFASESVLFTSIVSLIFIDRQKTCVVSIL